MAFLSPEPVTINWSSVDTSQLRTDEDSFDCKGKNKRFPLIILIFMYKSNINNTSVSMAFVWRLNSLNSLSLYKSHGLCFVNVEM